jgi:endonuclease/exonuclease/phosphatase (EEP) superfamily protein YafD
VKGLQLKAFEPRDTMPTFLATGHRLDWILISGDMDFVRYEVLPDRVSDHQPLLAELSFR